MTSKRRSIALAVAASLAAVAPAAASASAGPVMSVQSPTGNIVCRAVVGSMLKCDVKSDGLGVNFDAYGKPTYTGRHHFTGGRVLGYGRTAVTSHFRCTSMVSGMRCVERHTGRGVFLSRGGNTYRF